MKVSVITVVYNGERFLESCIRSVLAQDYPDIEYIVIDGGSTDGTVEIIRKYENRIAKWISEKDKGIYDAINKGLARATGDVVAVLNADDFYTHPRVISRVVQEFRQSGTDTLFGDLQYVRPGDEQHVVRFYSGSPFRTQHLRKGDMPPHPTFFARMALFRKYGFFDPGYRICADFELMLRFLYVHRCSWRYLPDVMVTMRTGGVSTRGLKSTLVVNREMLRACRQNGVPTSLLRIYSKYFTKVWQLVKRPPQVH